MKYQLYFPSRQASQLAWLRQFRLSLPAQNEWLNLPEDTYLGALRDLDWIIYVMGPLLNHARKHAAACTSTLHLLLSGRGTQAVSLPAPDTTTPPPGEPPPPGALNRIFRLVKTIKNHRNYTPPMGHALGIIGNLHADDSPVPVFTLRVVRGARWEEVEGAFRRFGRTAVYVETRRGGGAWEKLGQYMGIFAGSRFIDARPLLHPATPELREYRLRFFEDSAATGDWSAVASVTVSP